MNKKYITLTVLLFVAQVVVCQYQWTWMAGERSENVGRVYGLQGIASPFNNPGSRIGAAFWTDKQGNLWLFGGRGNNAGAGLLNDLWTYNISTGYWTWMGGERSENSTGKYERKGEASPGNNPGARQNGVYWTDNNGDFWLFGGRGMPSESEDDDDDDDGGESLLNDLWKYSTATNQWTFVSGSDRRNRPGRYGTRTLATESNYPGARYSASGWIDDTGNLWLFGGRGYTADDQIALLDDVWRYSPTENSWAWMTGDQGGNEAIRYGQKGVPDNSNTPGGRHGCISWTGNNGDFWLYGGGTLRDLFADLWKYDYRNNRWTWMSGSSTPNEQPRFSSRGVPGLDAHPGARTLSVVWVDPAGDVLLFGGNGYGGEGGSRPLNNLWKYSDRTNEWTFLTGEISSNASPVYGTKGEPGPGNTPGGTASASSWKDLDGNFWLFGGRSSEGYLNQVWKLSPACGNITGNIAPATASICEGGSQVLTATGGTSYEWRLNNALIQGETGATITATAPGTYSVMIKNGECSGPASNTAEITLDTKPSGSISPATASICEGQSQVLTATGGTIYEWRRDGVTIEGEVSATITVATPGIYSVIINNNGCIGEASNTSVVTLAAKAGTRYADVHVAPNVPAQLSAKTAGIAFEWIPGTGLDNPNSPTPMVTVTENVEYLIRIVREGGCEIMDTLLVKVDAGETKIFVPTAFTPDGNSVNDRLRPLGGLASITFFRIYNRWGNKIFETDQLGAGWDGRYNGVPQPSDTYTWVLSAKLPNGQQVKQSGKCLLIR